MHIFSVWTLIGPTSDCIALSTDNEYTIGCRTIESIGLIYAFVPQQNVERQKNTTKMAKDSEQIVWRVCALWAVSVKRGVAIRGSSSPHFDKLFMIEKCKFIEWIASIRSYPITGLDTVRFGCCAHDATIRITHVFHVPHNTECVSENGWKESAFYWFEFVHWVLFKDFAFSTL